MHKIAVIGTGYVGLVTGTCFAEKGNKVICVDIDLEKVDRLNRGEVTIFEPGLDILLSRNLRQKRITFSTDTAAAIRQSDIIFLALPTPPGEDGSADLSYIIDFAAFMTPLLNGYKLIVNKSTVPVGTAEMVSDILSKNVNAEVDVVSNPEFLREGSALDDFQRPDRVVIGAATDRARQIMARLYEPFLRQDNRVIFMDVKSAELTKYAANAYLALRISFINEIANLCDRVGADVDAVRRGIGSDARIGKKFLFPGVGYGGSCFPKDVRALARTAQRYNYDSAILNAVSITNEKQKKILVDKAKQYFGGSLAGKQIAIWGLSYKANTDDVREAPSLDIISQLLESGARVTVFDPEGMDNIKKMLGSVINYASSAYDAIKGMDALFIITEWNEFRNPDFDLIRQSLNSPVIFDGRNLYNLEDMKALGIHYESIGRPAVN